VYWRTFIFAPSWRRKGHFIMAIKLPKGVKTPPLLVAIYRDGKLVSHTKISDPRKGYCRLMNQVHPSIKAIPVSKRIAKGGGAR
jgi:hypothetical protein